MCGIFDKEDCLGLTFFRNLPFLYQNYTAELSQAYVTKLLIKICLKHCGDSFSHVSLLFFASLFQFNDTKTFSVRRLLCKQMQESLIISVSMCFLHSHISKTRCKFSIVSNNSVFLCKFLISALGTFKTDSVRFVCSTVD